MKNFILLFITFLASSLSAQYDGDFLFKEGILHEIRIESDNPEFFNDMISEFESSIPGEYTYLPAKIIIDGQIVDSVGVRIKGGISGFDYKRPLKLDFNRFIETQSFDGLKKVNLHNAYFDSSVQREAISYEILRRAGLKTPRTAFTQVYINDELHGVYVIVEQIDNTFLRNYFAEESGVLYKTGIGGLDIKSDTGTFAEYDHLMDVVENFSGSALKDTLDKILDTEAFLRNNVTQNVINAVDNLFSVNTNFYLFHERKSDLMYYIPWDFNLAFFPFIDHPVDQIPDNPIGEKMLAVPSYEERYFELFCHTLDYNFVESRLHDLLDARKLLIQDAIQVDPRISFTFQEFEAEHLVNKQWVTDRINALYSQLNTLGVSCTDLTSPIPFQAITINEVVASADSLGAVADPAGGFPDWIELYNNTSNDISLERFYLSDDINFQKHWAFPAGTMIPSYGYLIVWADRDLDETGLHSDFKLSKSKGELFLIYEDFTLIDSMSYQEQETNVAYARVPNGTGNFTKQAMTFNDQNDPLDIPEQLIIGFDWKVYPNPTSDYFTISVPVNYMDQVQSLSIVNSMSQEMLNQNNLKIDVRNLIPGFYFIRLELKNGSTYYKQVIISK